MKKIMKTIQIKAAPAVVWAYLTEKDKIGLWFDPSETDLVEGQDYKMLHGDKTSMWGKVLEARAPELLVYTFNHDMLNHDTTVRWTLVAKDGGTELTLVHDGFEGMAGDVDKAVAEHDEGWGEHLDRLITHAEDAAEAA